jgi:hypothetical protein
MDSDSVNEGKSTRLRYISGTSHRALSPACPTEVNWPISDLGVGAGQKVLTVDIRFEFMLSHKSIQFSTVWIHVENSASVGECGERVRVGDVRSLGLPPHIGHIKHFARIDSQQFGLSGPL